MESLEHRYLLATTAQLVNDVVHTGWNAPFFVAAGDSTYQVVEYLKDDGRYNAIGRIDFDLQRTVDIEGKVQTHVAVDDQLFLVMYNRNEERNELWKTDGTEQGTTRLLAQFGGYALTEFRGQVYLSGSDQLWVTDGTESGTRVVADLNSDQTRCEGQCAVSAGREFRAFTELNGTLYFTRTQTVEEKVFKEVHGRLYPTIERTIAETEFWKSDGTSDGTQLVTTMPGSAGIIGASQSHIYGRMDKHLWRSDGTTEGTHIFHSLERGEWSVNRFTMAGDKLFYMTELTQSGRDRHQLWVTDGTAEGTHFVQETLLSGYNSCGGGSGLLAVGESVYFSAEDVSGNHSLWKSDGTQDGTVLVKHGRFQPIVADNNLVFLAGDDEATGIELWRSDGTPDGTVQVLDLNPGPESSLTRRSRVLSNNGMLYFTAFDPIYGTGTWRIPLDTHQLIDRPVGDSNNDGVFDSSDLVKVFQAGKYEDDVGQNASFDEGDWNGDGDFDSGDLVAAFQSGTYSVSNPRNAIAAAVDAVLSDEDGM